MTPEEAAEWLRGKDGACAQCEDYSVCEENIAAADLIESQAARIKELEPDAARYRWIRTAGAWESELGLDDLSQNPSEFDAAVDARLCPSPAQTS
jgi:hypothetical protein